MSEFNRTETYRRSIRRRKPLAPSPPSAAIQNMNTDATFESNRSDAASITNKLIAARRDFVALPSNSDQQQQSNVVKKAANLFDDADDSSLALMEIQKRINQIEFNSTIRNQITPPDPTSLDAPVRSKFGGNEPFTIQRKRDLTTSEEFDSDDHIFRGGAGRSSITGATGKEPEAKKKQFQVVSRTASDSKQIELIRKQRKKAIENKKTSEQQVKLH